MSLHQTFSLQLPNDKGVLPNDFRATVVRLLGPIKHDVYFDDRDRTPMLNVEVYPEKPIDFKEFKNRLDQEITSLRETKDISKA